MKKVLFQKKMYFLKKHVECSFDKRAKSLLAKNLSKSMKCELCEFLCPMENCLCTH